VRIYDAKAKKQLGQITLYLTPDEAAELADTARGLAKDPAQHHGHVSSADYSREVTIAVYTPDNLSQFDAESRNILADDAKSC
jgi:hypothetical protein